MQPLTIDKEYLVTWLTKYTEKGGDFARDYVNTKLLNEYEENLFNFLVNEPKDKLLKLIKELDYYKCSKFINNLLDKSDNKELAKLILFIKNGENIDIMTNYYILYENELEHIGRNVFINYIKTLNLEQLKDLTFKLLNYEFNIKVKTYTDDIIIERMEKVINKYK